MRVPKTHNSALTEFHVILDLVHTNIAHMVQL